MLLIENKVIEENKEHVEYKDGSSNFVIPVDYLLTHSKEVEVVDIDKAETDFMDENQYEGNFFEYAKQQGYQLIKIKQ